MKWNNLAFLFLTLMQFACNDDTLPKVNLSGQWSLDLLTSVPNCSLHNLPADAFQSGRVFTAQYEYRDIHGILVSRASFNGSIDGNDIKGIYSRDPGTGCSAEGTFTARIVSDDRIEGKLSGIAPGTCNCSDRFDIAFNRVK